MKTNKAIWDYAKAFLGFILLDVYLNVAIAGAGNIFLQLLLVAGFLPLLYLLLKWNGLVGFKDVGIRFHQKWTRNLLIGFGTGFSFWLMSYLLSWGFGSFELTGIKPFGESVAITGMVLGTFFIGSFFNDIITRGYIFAQLRNRIPVHWIFVISIVAYSFDDIWNEGFSLSNTLFSVLVGLSLTYAFYKSGSIWATTGIHWGLNVCYGLFNGTLGQDNGGIFNLTSNHSASLFLEVKNYLIPLLMFLFVMAIRKKLDSRSNDIPQGKSPSM
ncbi:CPBP family intramembrane glutamic endopeptidase [Neobacillus sp. YIM B06451]|uniref:CPBP family intramembrane glutamic endopeptidase n=1 Tax=Neobacillus sp. YIM B06451 TaxID=3070994 RepID=UPI00293184B3|nr:CPBP family intramembrane glutamic endopeptidase [Neobacillus sp. YIM B06451]